MAKRIKALAVCLIFGAALAAFGDDEETKRAPKPTTPDERAKFLENNAPNEGTVTEADCKDLDNKKCADQRFDALDGKLTDDPRSGFDDRIKPLVQGSDKKDPEAAKKPRTTK
jgi:hypothetical protein